MAMFSAIVNDEKNIIKSIKEGTIKDYNFSAAMIC